MKNILLLIGLSAFMILIMACTLTPQIDDMPLEMQAELLIDVE